MFKQFFLQPAIPQPHSDWVQSGNVTRTDKTLNVKDRFRVTEHEVNSKLGQSIKRTAFSTLVTGSVYSVAVNDFLVGITSLSYAPSIGLPHPAFVGEGKTYIIKDEAGGAGTTTITIRSDGEANIDGASSTTINTNYASRTLYSTGAAWHTI